MARTRRTPPQRRRRRMTYIAAEAALVLIALALAFGAGAVGFVVGRESAEDDPPVAEATEGEATERGETGTAETTEETTGETATETPETGEQTGETETAATETEGGGAEGEQVFASAGCATCHTLSAAGASATVGPNLDETQLGEDEIVEVVTNGRGAMPSFEGQLSGDEIRAVAAFVAGG